MWFSFHHSPPPNPHLGHFFKTWKKRWFVLTPGSLAYYKNKGDAEAKGIIPVNEKINCTPKDIAGHKYTFELECSDPAKPKYYIEAADEDDMEAWVNALVAASRPKDAKSTSFLFRLRSESKAAKAEAGKAPAAPAPPSKGSAPTELAESWPSYKNKKRNFVCEYPKRWVKKTSVTDGHWQVEFANGKSADCPGHIAIQVQEVAKVVGKPITLDQYLEISTKFNQAAPELKVLGTSKKVALGPLKAFDMDFIVKDLDSSIPEADRMDYRSTARSAISPDGSLAFVATLVTPVEASCDWHEHFSPYFERVVNSFNLIK